MARVGIRTLLEATDDVVLLDGGTGGCLEDRGVDVRNELWSSAALLAEGGRETTRELHREYFVAGADIVIANTHNLSPIACRAFLASAQEGGRVIPHEALGGRLLEELARRGVELACEAIPPDRDVVVAAGIGSAEPWARMTDRTPAQIRGELEPCARALSNEPETFILFETLSTSPEVAAVSRVVRELELDGFGLGLSCGPDARSWGGVSMTEFVHAFGGTRPAALFIQCTRYDLAAAALRELLDVLAGSDLDAVAGVYANDGREWKHRRWHGERVSPRAYADAAEAWREAGARIVGGCCGTGPEHVAELRRRWNRAGMRPGTSGSSPIAS